MDRLEALQLVAAELERLRHRPYVELAGMVDLQTHKKVTGRSGTRYQIEAGVDWDNGAGGDVRVFAMIDDGGMRAFQPITQDFIMRPDGTFVGEEEGEVSRVTRQPLAIRVVQVVWAIAVAIGIVWYVLLPPHANNESSFPSILLLFSAGFPASLGVTSLLSVLSHLDWVSIAPVFVLALWVGAGWLQWFVIVPRMWRRWSRHVEQFE